MTDYFYLFKYLKAENININESTFIEQISSHPNYPSLLSISDTLNFLLIENVVFEANPDCLDSLPNNFILLMDDKKSNEDYHFIEKKKNNLFKCYTKNSTEYINKIELINRWRNIILVSLNFENSKDENIIKPFKLLNFVLFSTLFSIIVLAFLLPENGLYRKITTFLSLIGVFLSIIANKDIFEFKNSLFEKICTISIKTDCDSVFNSNKIKFLEKIKINQLSLIYFLTEFVAIFLFSITIESNSLFHILKIISFSSILMVPFSIYYQKFIEKKWCPICLSISLILVLQLTVFLLDKTIVTQIDYKSIFILLFINSLITALWLIYKDLKLKNLKLYKYKGSVKSFLKDYFLFKSVLKRGEKITFPNDLIKIGNLNSENEITLITSLDCVFCKEITKSILFILKTNNKIKINIFYNTITKKLNNLYIVLFTTSYQSQCYSVEKSVIKVSSV